MGVGGSWSFEDGRIGERGGLTKRWVSGFSGMGIVEWWNSGMVEWIFFFIHFVCLFVYQLFYVLVFSLLLLFSGNCVFVATSQIKTANNVIKNSPETLFY